MTVDDVNELMKYAPKRIRTDKLDLYRNLLQIVNVGSFHEKGADKGYNSLMRQYTEPDDPHSYLNQKYDKGAMERFVAMRNRNLAMRPSK